MSQGMLQTMVYMLPGMLQAMPQGMLQSRVCMLPGMLQDMFQGMPRACFRSSKNLNFVRACMLLASKGAQGWVLRFLRSPYKGLF